MNHGTCRYGEDCYYSHPPIQRVEVPAKTLSPIAAAATKKTNKKVKKSSSSNNASHPQKSTIVRLPALERDVCDFCLEADQRLLRCSCKKVRYCGEKCQRSHWSHHEQHHFNTSALEKPEKPKKKVLFIEFGVPIASRSPHADPYAKAIYVTIAQGIAPEHVAIDTMEYSYEIVRQLKLAEYAAILIIGVGTDGPCPLLKKDNLDDVKKIFTEYVAVHGGALLFIPGEGDLIRVIFQQWFHKDWKMAAYTREEHLKQKSWDMPPSLTETRALDIIPLLPPTYNVKAVLLSHAKAEERLYSHQGLASVLLSPHGRGHIAFFGDVNCEKDTTRVLLLIVAHLIDCPLLGNWPPHCLDYSAASDMEINIQLENNITLRFPKAALNGFNKEHEDSYLDDDGEDDYDDDDSDDDDEGAMCGFTGDDVNTLLSYGIKPWESDAEEFLCHLSMEY